MRRSGSVFRGGLRRAASLLAALLLAGCGDEPTPPATPPNVPAATTATNVAAGAEPRLREFPLATGHPIEVAFLVEGEAQAALRCRDAATFDLVLEQDGVAPSTQTLTVGGGALTIVPLPGHGTRALRLKAQPPPELELGVLHLRDQPEPVAPSPLAGSWRGRSVAIVVCDALHAAHLSCYGADQPTSPAIDALAARGVRFTTVRAQTAWTVPSVATLFTGLTQEQHGVRDIGQVLADSLPTLAEEYQAEGYVTAAFLQNKLVTRETGLARGFDEWQEFPGESRDQLLPALERFLAAPRTEPLFLYVHLLPPHAPYQPPAEYAGRFGQPKGAIDGSVAALAELAQRQPKANDPHVVTMRGLYRNQVAYGDALAGAVARAFFARGETSGALLFLADHGEAFGQHEAVGHNVQVYDEMVQVPLIVVAPGTSLATGRVVTAPAWMPDLAPTLRELCGLPASSIECGRSLANLLATPADGAADRWPPDRPHALSARFLDGDARQRAIVFGSLKLVSPAGRRVTALYDLAVDPGETSDVSAAHPVLSAALREELARFAATARDGPSALQFTPDAKLRQELEALGYGASGR